MEGEFTDILGDGKETPICNFFNFFKICYNNYNF